MIMIIRNFKKMLFLSLLLTIIGSCNDTTAETQEQETQQQEQEEEVIDNTIEIIGNNVNARDEPTTDSKVITQVNSGEIFDILDKTENYEMIGKQVDYWYEIEKGGKAVWVFGTFTSKNLIDNPNTLRGVFEGTEWGDYFYLSIREYNSEATDNMGEISYAFGEALWLNSDGLRTHNFDKYDLVEEEEKYIGKIFDITWTVVVQDTYAGEGLMHIVQGPVPIITDLKLVE
jgi:hypothetical protein